MGQYAQHLRRVGLGDAYSRSRIFIDHHNPSSCRKCTGASHWRLRTRPRRARPSSGRRCPPPYLVSWSLTPPKRLSALGDGAVLGVATNVQHKHPGPQLAALDPVVIFSTHTCLLPVERERVRGPAPAYVAAVSYAGGGEGASSKSCIFVG